MAKRRRIPEEHENHERWLVSYADFITLLFAFFVVMYAISSVNEGKYRVLSESLAAAFSDPAAPRSPDPIQVGDIARGGSVIELVKDQTPPGGRDPGEGGNDGTRSSALDALYRQMQQTLSPFIDAREVSLQRGASWIEVDMKTSLLFASGSAVLGEAALPVLREVAGLLRASPMVIHVEGHTDDVPINTLQFPSNWELSAARAASVVHEFMRNGVDPRLMAAIGYAEYQPAGENKTEEGRNRNRRVALILTPLGQSRRQAADPARAFEIGLGAVR